MPSVTASSRHARDMPSLPVSRRRALVLAAAALALLAVAGRTLAGAGAAAEQPRSRSSPSRRRPRRSWSCTSPARSAGRACTGWPRANASPTRSPVRAERPRRPTPPRSTSPHRSRTGCRWSCRAGLPPAGGPSRGRRAPQPQLRHGSRAGCAARNRPRHGPEDPRLPRRARRLPLRRRPRCDPRDRPGADRAAARPGVALIARSWPTLLVAALCLGLALANAARAPALVVG